MAIGRLSVGVGKKGKASPHAKYIAREGKYAKPHNHAEKLENTGYGNMPKWAECNPNYFWVMADEHERNNGTTYREHVIALPRELDENQRHELVKEWIKNEIGDRHAYQYAIHNPPSLDGGEQPHAHIMFSERLRDSIERDPEQYFKRYNSRNPDKGGAKKSNTPKTSSERKAELVAMRERWEKMCNAHLERAGHSERISMKSLKDRGIDREPINLTMAQIQQPEIKQAYINVLDAREQAYQARLDIYRTLETTPITELNKQIREQAEQERAKQAQTKQQQEPTPPEPKPQDKQTEKTELSISDKYELMKEFDNQMQSDAEKLLNERLRAIRDDAKPQLEEIERLRDNKPLKPWKWKDWQQDIDRRVAEYEKIKETHDRLKAQGVTDADKQTAMKNYYLANPQDYERIVEINRELKEHERQQEQQTQQQERVSVTRSRVNNNSRRR